MSDPQTLAYESPQTTFTGVGIGTIALQIVGVYCIALGLPMITIVASAIGIAGQPSPVRQMLFAWVPLALYGVMGVLLIRFAPRLSAWLFRDSGGGIMSGPISTASGQYLQAMAFAVVGVVLMANAAPRLVSLIWMALMDMGRAFGAYGYMQMIEPVAQSLIGLALFLQSRGLSLLWHKVRTGGVIGPQPAEQPVHSESEKA